LVSRQKKTFYPQERDGEARKAWLQSLGKLDVGKLVFIDETSSFLNLSRSYAWAHKSERAFDSYPKGKKEKVSLIAAIGLTKNLAEHAIIHPDSVDKNAFKAYLKTTLLPRLEADTILVLDNWTVHHGADIKALVEAFNCKLLYLPTYSPDLNPIEYLFSKIKALIKKLRPLKLVDLLLAFENAARSISLQDIRNTFRHCGYLVQ